MKNLARITGLCTFVFVVCGASSAMADPTTGQPDRKAPLATVIVGTSLINKLSGIYSTDNFICGTTVQNMLSRTIFNSQAGSVAVHFQSENFAGCRLLIGLKRNGVVVPGPGDAASPMASHDTAGDLSTNGFVWTVPNVPSGLQTFAATCQCISGTHNLVDERSMAIYHR